MLSTLTRAQAIVVRASDISVALEPRPIHPAGSLRDFYLKKARFQHHVIGMSKADAKRKAFWATVAEANMKQCTMEEVREAIAGHCVAMAAFKEWERAKHEQTTGGMAS